MNQVVEFFKGLFEYNRWPPRWKCGYWTDFHGWLYIISDLMVWAAYFMIPIIIINYFYKKKASIRFHSVYVLFASFILLCGTTHFLDAVMFWIPIYRLNAVVRFITGVVSLFTVYQLVYILPVAFKQKTNLELENEIVRREEAERKLAEANLGLQAFASMASHDLQEPLRKIRTYASLLYQSNEATFDVKSKGYADKVMNSAERMQSLIRDVLTLSTITGDVELEEVDTNNAVNSALESLEMSIEEKNATIEVSPLPKVRGNDAYLAQLFFNLIGNSLKFTDKPPLITIQGEHIEDRVLLHIRDNGIGMEEEDLNRIFGAFERLHSKTKYEGTGLGLAICKRIVEAHGGKLSVKSKVNEGTTFTIELQAA